MPEPSHAWVRNHFDPAGLRGGLRGVERETLRVDRNGRLARTPHPLSIGSALTHPQLTTDYSEALLEFVTPPFPANAATLENLTELHAFVQRRLDGELLWPASMPCIGDSDDEVPIADYGPSNAGLFRTVYRRGLGHRYGRAMQAIAGIHFNYSPPPALWPALREAVGDRSAEIAFRSARLMGLVRNYRRLAWATAYLFGASPVIAKTFRPGGHPRLEPLSNEDWYAPYATSLRMSDLGYRNKTQAGPGISANSLATFIGELRAAVSTPLADFEAIGIEVDGEFRQLNANVLQIENEYYSSIRPKPRDRGRRPVDALERDGVEYVELRNLDSDPTALVGIGVEQMCVSELILLYCLLEDSPPIAGVEQAEIDRRELAIAWEGRKPGLRVERNGAPVLLADWGLELADRLAALAETLGADYVAAAERVREAFRSPGTTPSAQMLEKLADRRLSLLDYGLELAEAHRAAFEAYTFAPGREVALDAAAAASLDEARALESADSLPFADYLDRYFAGSGPLEGQSENL